MEVQPKTASKNYSKNVSKTIVEKVAKANAAQETVEYPSKTIPIEVLGKNIVYGKAARNTV